VSTANKCRKVTDVEKSLKFRHDYISNEDEDDDTTQLLTDY
jgi:hypothetical protein